MVCARWRSPLRHRNRHWSPSPVPSARLPNACSARIAASTGFFGRPQKYQQAPTARAATLAIEFVQADRGMLIIASKKTIHISATTQSVRETSSAPPSIFDFLLAPQSAAPTTMPYSTYINSVQTPVITTSTLAHHVNAAAITATVQTAFAGTLWTLT